MPCSAISPHGAIIMLSRLTWDHSRLLDWSVKPLPYQQPRTLLKMACLYRMTKPQQVNNPDASLLPPHDEAIVAGQPRRRLQVCAKCHTRMADGYLRSVILPGTPCHASLSSGAFCPTASSEQTALSEQCHCTLRIGPIGIPKI